jgi:uncharacterized protein (UPF0332 family)
MAFPDELHAHAVFLADLDLGTDAKQVHLRRAVSAAYYAVFHLLTLDAAENWRHDRHRPEFARLFDHSAMKNCSNAVSSKRYPDPKNAAVVRLKFLAAAFVKLQQDRHDADYNNAKIWTRKEVYGILFLAEDAMDAWKAIRDEDIAQDYLLDLVKKRR